MGGMSFFYVQQAIIKDDATSIAHVITAIVCTYKLKFFVYSQLLGNSSFDWFWFQGFQKLKVATLINVCALQLAILLTIH